MPSPLCRAVLFSFSHPQQCSLLMTAIHLEYLRLFSTCICVSVYLLKQCGCQRVNSSRHSGLPGVLQFRFFLKPTTPLQTLLLYYFPLYSILPSIFYLTIFLHLTHTVIQSTVFQNTSLSFFFFFPYSVIASVSIEA